MKKLFITVLIILFMLAVGMKNLSVYAAQGNIPMIEQKKDDKKKDPPGPPPVKPKGPKGDSEPKPKDKKPGN